MHSCDCFHSLAYFIKAIKWDSQWWKDTYKMEAPTVCSNHRGDIPSPLLYPTRAKTEVLLILKTEGSYEGMYTRRLGLFGLSETHMITSKQLRSYLPSSYLFILYFLSFPLLLLLFRLTKNLYSALYLSWINNSYIYLFDYLFMWMWR